MPMKIKTVKVGDKEYAELSPEGKPVYVQDDGSEIEFDGSMAFSKISQLTKENEKHRKTNKELDEKLKTYEGIDDPEAARAALEKVQSLSEGENKTAEQIEEIRKNANKAAEERIAKETKAANAKIEELQKSASTLQGQLYEEKIGGSFARSKFVNERLAVPWDMAKKYFGDRFKIEDGKVVAYEDDGQHKIGSRKNPGSDADFEEAIEIMVDVYPHKDHILRAKGGGSGGRQGAGGNGTGDKTITRQQFDALDPLAKQKTMTDGIKVVDAPQP